MAYITLNDDEFEFTLGEDATKQREESRIELADMLIFAVEHVPGFQSMQLIKPLTAMLNEFIHWQYDTSGNHPKVTEMLQHELDRAVAEEKDMAADLGGSDSKLDWPGGDTLANYKRKDGKTDA